jgi:predicted ATPase with chaperone activity
MKVEVVEMNWQDNPVLFKDILGNASAKRAMEVALVGGHSMVLISTVNSPAQALAQAGAAMATYIGNLPYKVKVVPVCECGGCGSPKFECTCSLKTLEKHNKRMSKLTNEMDMFVETVAPRAMDTSKSEEGSNEFMIRIMDGIKHPAPEKVGIGAEELVRMAVSELGVDRVKVLKIAKTIAQMDNSREINEVHVSEATQYVRSPFGRYLDQYQEVTA